VVAVSLDEGARRCTSASGSRSGSGSSFRARGKMASAPSRSRTLLAHRELDDALGSTSTVDSQLRDLRTGKNTQHRLTALLRQSIYSRLAGCDDTSDAERVAADSGTRHVAGSRAVQRSGAFTGVMSRLETEILDRRKNGPERRGEVVG
jgi:hypothetical protein